MVDGIIDDVAEKRKQRAAARNAENNHRHQAGIQKEASKLQSLKQEYDMILRLKKPNGYITNVLTTADKIDSVKKRWALRCPDSEMSIIHFNK